MTPAEFENIAEAFEREEGRREYTFDVRKEASGFMANVRRHGTAIAVVGGVLMPGGGVHPWVVTAANDKAFLPIEPFERSRDLVRRLIVAVEKAPEPVPVVRGSFSIEEAPGVCPGCKEAFSGEQTTVFYSGEDLNRASCECGWVGRVCDLLYARHPDNCSCDDCHGECNFCGATARKLVDFNGSLTWACSEHAGTFAHDPRTVH